MTLYIKIPIPRLPSLLTLPSLYVFHALNTLISYLESLFSISSNNISDSLRVSRITFFTHGLACLEHTATVQGDTRHKLSIRPSAMADLEKTLIVHPGTGGTVKSISYDAPPSAHHQTDVDVVYNVGENRLPYPKAIASKSVITELLNEHIGSPMTVFHNKGSVTGRVMGLQRLQSADTETLSTIGAELPATGSSEDAVVLLQDDDGLMVPVRLSHLRGLRLDDPKREEVAVRFRRAAERGRTGLTIVTKGDDERKLTVKYAVEAAVCKVTYRVILLDEHNLYIQAWAIVDNPSDERLDDVEVVIISGLPMSFRHDVYQARFISRPVEPVCMHAGITAEAVPVEHLHERRVADRRKSAFGTALSPPSYNYRRRGSSIRNEETEPVQHQQETIPRWSDSAETSAAGSVHEYRIPGRVTIPARESALLPLIMATTPGGQVDMYVHEIRATNTLRATKIVNTTTAPFERGPVAVYDENTLVGEGMIPACQPGADVLMPYSVNVQCKVERRETDGKRGFVRECFVSSGQFFLRRYVEKVTVYDFSEQSEALEVVVVHAGQKGCVDINGEILPTKYVNDNTAERIQIMAEKAEGGVWHFRVTIEAEVKTSLRVKESQLVTSSYDVSTAFNNGIFASITHEGLAGRDTLDRIRRVTEVKREVDVLVHDIKILKNEGKDVETTQQRYRENIIALGSGHGRMKDFGLATEYAQRVRESEMQIDDIKAKIIEKQGIESELRMKFAEVMAEFEINELEENVESGEENGCG